MEQRIRRDAHAEDHGPNVPGASPCASRLWTADAPDCTLAALLDIGWSHAAHRGLHPGRHRRFRGPPPTHPPTRRRRNPNCRMALPRAGAGPGRLPLYVDPADRPGNRSEEHTSELQSLAYLVCRLLLEKKKNI